MKDHGSRGTASTGTPPATASKQALLDYADLVSDLLHDFRTPLGSIVGAASVLNDYGGASDEAVRARLCSGIIDQAQRLDSLLAALAAIARARSGKLVSEEQPLELNELLHGLSTKLRSHPERPARISIEEYEVFLKADPAIIQTVLAMMLDLAFVYAADESHTELSLSSNAQHATLRVESDVRNEGRMRLQDLIKGHKERSLTQPTARRRRSADSVFLAAIQEFVHILGGKFTIQHNDAVARLCQTVMLPMLQSHQGS